MTSMPHTPAIEEDLTQMSDDEEATSGTWLLSIEMILSKWAKQSESAGGNYNNRRTDSLRRDTQARRVKM